MRFRPPSPDLESFDDASRASGDEDLATRLTRLVRNVEDGLVIIFNGRWGTGKTTFLRRWNRRLARDGVPVIYLDAFRADHLDSPFIAIAGSISRAVKLAHKEKDPKYKRFLAAASHLGRGLASTTARVGVKAATLGVVDVDLGKTATELASTLSDGVADYAESAVKQLIEDNKNREEQIADLTQSLSELRHLLAGEHDDLPLVFIVDDLDRCRPDFALSFVEIIKHFFFADRIHFVVCANRRHLEASVEHRYGNSPASDSYLRRFYDPEVNYDSDYSIGD